MLLIYCQELSPRLSYVVNLVFHELLGVKTKITTSQETFNSSQLAKLNYSTEDVESAVSITPGAILFERGINKKTINTGSPWYGLPTLLFSGEPEFDPLGMIFFLVSRYEEYGDFTADDHNRFPATESCLYRHNLLEKPIVNKWALRLLEVLKDRYPDLKHSPRRYHYISTIDVDQAWKYTNKGAFRTLGGLIVDLFKGRRAEILQRIRVLIGMEDDPFDTFRWQEDIHHKYHPDVQYFIQVGDRGKFDKNTSADVRAFRNHVVDLDDHYKVGIHPSYQSNKKPHLLAQELQLLENIVAHDVVKSRQHFLIHEMPKTYQNLIDVDIKEDYTMGYSTHIGFRAGIAAPFNFFNLQTNTEEKLKLFPFSLMDITPLHYLGLSVKEAEEKCADLIWEVQDVGGLFISLWHNESVSDDGRWKGWSRLYEYVVATAKGLEVSTPS